MVHEPDNDLTPAPGSDPTQAHVTPADQAAPLGAVTSTATVDYAGLAVGHTGLEPQTSRQGPRQVLFCYSHVWFSAWTG